MGVKTDKQERLLQGTHFLLPRNIRRLLLIFCQSLAFALEIQYLIWHLMCNVFKHNIVKFSFVPCFTSIFLEFPLYQFLFCPVLCDLPHPCQSLFSLFVFSYLKDTKKPIGNTYVSIWWAESADRQIYWRVPLGDDVLFSRGLPKAICGGLFLRTIQFLQRRAFTRRPYCLLDGSER